MIPFDRSLLQGQELDYIREATRSGQIASRTPGKVLLKVESRPLVICSTGR